MYIHIYIYMYACRVQGLGFKRVGSSSTLVVVWPRDHPPGFFRA